MTPTRRNLLLITTDQERWHQTDPAPLAAHDRLRAAGTTFDRFYGASVACSPARSVIYTGQHVAHTGVIEQRRRDGPSQDSRLRRTT
jgi:arylsulfatase A-like enzyme